MTDSPLNKALRHFEVAEANLSKLEKIWDEIYSAIPPGVVFGNDRNYDDNCRSFEDIVAALPSIDAWKPAFDLMSLDEIGQNRLDAIEVGEFESQVSVERRIEEPLRLLQEYRYRLIRSDAP